MLLKTISKDISTNFIDLNIYSKENYTIMEFLEIEAGLHDVNKNSSENILKALEILLNVTKTNIEENVSEKGNDLSNYIEQLLPTFFSHIKNTIELIKQNKREKYIFLLCKKLGKGQKGYFHFPSLFTGIYRTNKEEFFNRKSLYI